MQMALANKVSVVEVYENRGGSLPPPTAGIGWATSVSMNTTDIVWGDYNDAAGTWIPESSVYNSAAHSQTPVFAGLSE